MILTGMTRDHLSRAEDRDHLADRTPLRAVGAPEDIAHAVLYLAGDLSAFVTGADKEGRRTSKGCMIFTLDVKTADGMRDYLDGARATFTDDVEILTVGSPEVVEVASDAKAEPSSPASTPGRTRNRQPGDAQRTALCHTHPRHWLASPVRPGPSHISSLPGRPFRASSTAGPFTCSPPGHETGTRDVDFTLHAPYRAKSTAHGAPERLTVTPAERATDVVVHVRLWPDARQSALSPVTGGAGQAVAARRPRVAWVSAGRTGRWWAGRRPAGSRSRSPSAAARRCR